jgi:hypothetical protein
VWVLNCHAYRKKATDGRATSGRGRLALAKIAPHA